MPINLPTGKWPDRLAGPPFYKMKVGGGFVNHETRRPGRERKTLESPPPAKKLGINSFHGKRKERGDVLSAEEGSARKKNLQGGKIFSRKGTRSRVSSLYLWAGQNKSINDMDIGLGKNGFLLEGSRALLVKASKTTQYDGISTRKESGLFIEGKEQAF